MTRPTGEDEMNDMTDERAAEVLAAHNAWRRYNGETGEPGAPEMGDPTELGRAIDHAVSRLRSQPPAEARSGDWVMVPREPTPEMGIAFGNAPGHSSAREELRLAWSAMLAAAPQPPAEAQAQGGGVDGFDQWHDAKWPKPADTDPYHWRALWDDRKRKRREVWDAALAAQPHPPPSAPVGVEDSFSAADMADAAAQGFRDGVASVGVVGVERKYPDDGNGDDDAYNRGWNDCLDALAQQPAAEARIYQCPRCATSLEVDPTAKPAAVDGAAVRWAVERWNDEVANRPLVNVYRRTLDGTWRQVIRHFGGDDVTLCGPRHDDLAAQQGGRSDD